MGFKVNEVLEKKNKAETKKGIRVYYLIKYKTLFVHLEHLVPRKKLFRIIDRLKLKTGISRWELIDDELYEQLVAKGVKFNEETFKI